MPAIRTLRDTLAAKSDAFADVVMVGPHPFAGCDADHARAGDLRLGRRNSTRRLDAIDGALPGVYELAIGGTAVGTGLNAHPRFGEVTARKIAEETGKPFVSAPNKFAALSAHDAMVNVSAALRTLAGALMKIANDVRWYACGPRAGIRRADDPGERARLLDHAGEDQSDPMRGADDGGRAGVRQRPHGGLRGLARQLPAQRLQTGDPAQRSGIGWLLADACLAFDEHCARGIEPNEKRIKEHLDNSLMLVTALNPHIGYEKSAKISLTAIARTSACGKPR